MQYNLKFKNCLLFQNLYNFLAQPNAVSHLDISATDTMLESVSF